MNQHYCGSAQTPRRQAVKILALVVVFGTSTGTTHAQTDPTNESCQVARQTINNCVTMACDTDGGALWPSSCRLWENPADIGFSSCSQALIDLSIQNCDEIVAFAGEFMGRPTPGLIGESLGEYVESDCPPRMGVVGFSGYFDDGRLAGLSLWCYDSGGSTSHRLFGSSAVPAEAIQFDLVCPTQWWAAGFQGQFSEQVRSFGPICVNRSDRSFAPLVGVGASDPPDAAVDGAFESRCPEGERLLAVDGTTADGGLSSLAPVCDDPSVVVVGEPTRRPRRRGRDRDSSDSRDDGPTWRDHVSRLSPSSYEIRGDAFDAMLDDPELFQPDSLEFQQAFNDGSPSGIRTTRVPGSSVFSALGLRQGDVWISINGNPVTTPAQVVDFYEALRNDNVVTLEVQRRGLLRTLTYTFVDRPSEAEHSTDTLETTDADEPAPDADGE